MNNSSWTNWPRPFGDGSSSPPTVRVPTCGSPDPTGEDAITACPRCGHHLEPSGGLLFCPRCTDALGERFGALAQSLADFTADTDRIVIACPGATLYLPDSDQVTAGVRFLDANDPSRGYEMVGRPVYGPAHVSHRWVKRQDAHLIRRCQSCQDFTIRMSRKEGPDLFIPSRRHPRSQRLSHRYPPP